MIIFLIIFPVEPVRREEDTAGLLSATSERHRGMKFPVFFALEFRIRQATALDIFKAWKQ